MIQNNNAYINIQYWMINRLGLKGNELIIYAMIHGFSQDGNSYCFSSLDYFMKWTDLSKQTVITVLKNLINKNLIVKKISREIITNKGVIKARGSQYFCFYYSVESRTNETENIKQEIESKNLTPTGQKTLPEKQQCRVKKLDPYGSKNLTPTGQKFRHNNLVYITKDTSTSDNEIKKIEEEFIKQELTKIFKHYVFDDNFTASLNNLFYEFNINHSSYSLYLNYIMNETIKRKPISKSNLFYKLALSKNMINDFQDKKEIEKNTNKIANNVKISTCPICGNKVNSLDKCSICGFDMNYVLDQETVKFEQQIFKLSDFDRNSFKKEYKKLILHKTSLGREYFLNKRIKQEVDNKLELLYHNYGITV